MVFRSLAAFGLALFAAASARAADISDFSFGEAPALRGTLSPVYVHVGAAGLLYDVSARIKAFNVPLPGATVTIDDTATAAVELGYFLTDNIAVSATGGYPPLSKVVAAGTLAGLGTVGKIQGGPAGLTVHYHVDGLGAFRPYIGGGVAMLFIMNDNDALLRRLTTRNAVGPAIQGGFDYWLDDHWGVFFDVKKAFLTARTTGYLGSTYLRSKVALDPLVIHSGVSYRF